jgi:hypothetical protein
MTQVLLFFEGKVTPWYSSTVTTSYAGGPLHICRVLQRPTQPTMQRFLLERVPPFYFACNSAGWLWFALLGNELE